jgi:hypothetical protein
MQGRHDGSWAYPNPTLVLLGLDVHFLRVLSGMAQDPFSQGCNTKNRIVWQQLKPVRMMAY